LGERTYLSNVSPLKDFMIRPFVKKEDVLRYRVEQKLFPKSVRVLRNFVGDERTGTLTLKENEIIEIVELYHRGIVANNAY
jgi:hypothetical protein